MLKDIVVHIPADQRAAAIIDFAVSLACTFDAHLDGTARIYRSLNPAIGIGASAAAVAIAAQYDPDMELAVNVLDKFDAAATDAGIRHGMRTICDSPSFLLRAVVELSCLYNLVVVPQPDPSILSDDDSLPEMILVDSGRPILLLPYIQHGSFKADRVLIGWDGGPAAARAVQDALPFLRRAAVIDILTVDSGGEITESSPEALKSHLVRQGLPAAVHRLPRNSTSTFDTILSLAADLNSELIVMGGYGHSKLRESILGGVTRGIFETLTVPAFISH
jgi:nucleotide-binding universal stress UspA family protein